jgi:hypothetical protein
MHGDVALIDAAGRIEKGRRARIGEIKNRDEAWLRDTLYDHPDILPIESIDPTFGPLTPLCKDLRTGAALIDAVYVNGRGQLTLLQCRPWKNPQAMREVAEQTLHGVTALTNWTYVDLERHLATAADRTGSLRLAQARSRKRLREQAFMDAVSRSLWEGRFLVLLVGEGIAQEIQSLTELIDRNAAKASCFGLVEMALYRLDQGRVAIQPRVVAATEVVTRRMAILDAGAASAASAAAADDAASEPRRRAAPRARGHLRDWWQPVLQMTFDDPEQERPFWVGTNNVVLKTPFRGIHIKAFAIVNGARIGVFLSGTRKGNLLHLRKHLAKDRRSLLRDLPKGTRVAVSDCDVILDTYDCTTDAEKRAWICTSLNAFANALRPRLREWYRQSRP